ncbi:MAG TPA: ATP-dependent sacrificial sulfur transferase LarE [Clostridiales bacterium]|jgi:uncharacterized protein|nr:ATP-dependent sacrificial sulfur transferase LarE [Clostridiales bacterium]
MTLNEFFAENPRAALAFSGGVDSTYLLYAGLQSGADIRPYYIKTAFNPDSELEAARQLCESLGVSLQVLELDVFAFPEVISNPCDRCYYCKRALFSALLERTAADGYPVLLDGTNASDDFDDRPGMRALQEFGVRSPLRECGLTKPKIRALSREVGLPTWNMPSKACLATRIPAGTKITKDALQRVAGAEEALSRIGFWDLRVRKLGEVARIQLPEEQLGRAMELRSAIIKELSPFFTEVVLDMIPRKKSE